MVNLYFSKQIHNLQFYFFPMKWYRTNFCHWILTVERKLQIYTKNKAQKNPVTVHVSVKSSTSIFASLYNSSLCSYLSPGNVQVPNQAGQSLVQWQRRGPPPGGIQCHHRRLWTPGVGGGAQDRVDTVGCPVGVEAEGVRLKLKPVSSIWKSISEYMYWLISYLQSKISHL